MIFLGDCGPGEPDHGAEQRDGRAERGEQRQPQCDQQVHRNVEIELKDERGKDLTMIKKVKKEKKKKLIIKETNLNHDH